MSASESFSIFFGDKLERTSFFFKQLAADLDRFRALLLRDPVAHAISRARRDNEVQPIA
jgi:hypothetical protein